MTYGQPLGTRKTSCLKIPDCQRVTSPSSSWAAVNAASRFAKIGQYPAVTAFVLGQLRLTACTAITTTAS